jgi:hypothetical protein
MSDLLYFFHADSYYYYNHGARPWKGDPDLVGFVGSNQLYGDGRVAWKKARNFNRAALEAGDATQGFVRGYSTTRSIY